MTAGVELMRSPTPRGLIAVAGSSGEVVLADPKHKLKVEHTIKAHSSNVVAMDVSGSLLATAGLSTHRGHLVHDTIVKVKGLTNIVHLSLS